MSSGTAEKLTNLSLLKKNISLNFLIHGITIVTGVLTVPIILKGIGIERFGILTIIWAVIGYSSIFDLGLGRALTQAVSKKLGEGCQDEIPLIIWTSMSILLLLGAVASALLLSLSSWVIHMIKVPKTYSQEALSSMYLLSFSVPCLIGIMGLKGVLESYQRFSIISWLRVPVLISNYIAPIFILSFTNSLFYIVLALVIGRFITLVGHIWAVSYTVEGFLTNITFSRPHVKPLIKFGSWSLVSNIVTPLMTSMDRFIISALLTSEVIAYYTTPFDVISKMYIVPTALMSVMFPAFSTKFTQDPHLVREMYSKSLINTFMLLFLPVLIVVLFAKSLIGLWINDVFAENSYHCAQLIALGIFCGCLNHIPFTVIQASGRSDITGKIHLAEFPIYLLVLFIFIRSFGFIGAPLAFLTRFVLDTIVFHLFTLRYLKRVESQ